MEVKKHRLPKTIESSPHTWEARGDRRERTLDKHMHTHTLCNYSSITTAHLRNREVINNPPTHPNPAYQ